MNILYVSDGYFELSVFASQVHSLCNEHAKRNKVRLLAFSNEPILNISEKAKYELLLRPKWKLGVFPILIYLRAVFLNGKRFIINDIDVIHCRGPIMTNLIYYLCRILNKKIPIISDFRGELEAEIGSYKKKPIWLWRKYAKRVEKKALLRANHVFFVSTAMRDHYIRKYDLLLNCDVFPTVVDSAFFLKSNEVRIKIRSELKIDNRFVYIYVGGIDKWQNLGLMIRKFNEAYKENKRLFFVILTSSPSKVLELAHLYCEESIKSLYVKNVPHEQVPLFLNAADAGIIHRVKNLINSVAAPTKIGEYLACGIKIIDNVEDIGNLSADASDKYKFSPLLDISQQQQDIYHSITRGSSICK